MTGRDNRLHRERRVWHDYKFYMWWSAGADGRYGTADDVLTAPPVNTNAVQTMCAACHLTGWERYQDTATGQFLVRAVNDPGGEMNIDDDPELDEINVGCESCHGPGSEHVANGGRSRFIVNPSFLSAERSSALCGRCHDRRQGYGGPTIGYTQAISDAGELAPPGISRHELITRYTDPIKKGPTMRGPGREDNIWPDDVHSNKPHQQYADFLKSKMYRNDRQLVACSDCHDMHGGTPYPRALIHDPDDAASPLCQRCHTVDVLSHMETKLNAKMKGQQTTLHRLPHAGHRQYRRHRRRLRQDDQDAALCQRAGRREQRLLAGPVEVPCVRRAAEDQRGGRRRAAGPGDADSVHRPPAAPATS